MKKLYCLVVTDDYSRFTWVFFLATTDETSGILKSFITRIENLVDHEVKVIRCDNGTEFKNKEMNQFCEMKEAVNTACYVQNRVLVVKPHNKTPYELFHGRTLTLSFMRPFGCRVTILNTIDPLGKVDGKADEGTQSNKFAGTKASDNKGQARKETEPVKDYILLPLWTADPPFSRDPKSSHDDGFKPSNNELPFDPNMPALENVSIFNFSNDDEDDGIVADMNNLDTTIQVCLILTIRIHKDYPLDQVIGDLHSATQTKRMTQNLEEHGFTSAIQQRTNHKDLQNYLFACFLSQEEPKKVIHALKDPR
nr:hypothetical protein [Tanacetum cinerariifolium]